MRKVLNAVYTLLQNSCMKQQTWQVTVWRIVVTSPSTPTSVASTLKVVLHGQTKAMTAELHACALRRQILKTDWAARKFIHKYLDLYNLQRESISFSSEMLHSFADTLLRRILVRKVINCQIAIWSSNWVNFMLISHNYTVLDDCLDHSEKVQSSKTPAPYASGIQGWKKCPEILMNLARVSVNAPIRLKDRIRQNHLTLSGSISYVMQEDDKWFTESKLSNYCQLEKA